MRVRWEPILEDQSVDHLQKTRREERRRIASEDRSEVDRVFGRRQDPAVQTVELGRSC
jgi:hypothetical protein